MKHTLPLLLLLSLSLSAITGTCNRPAESGTAPIIKPPPVDTIAQDTTRIDTTHIDTAGLNLNIRSIIHGSLICRRTIIHDTTILSADSIGINAIPPRRFESCWRDSQGGAFFYRIYRDSVMFPMDYLDLTLLQDTTEVYFLKAIYAADRWSDTADYDFKRFPAGCVCGSDTGWKRDKLGSFGFKRRNGFYNWNVMMAIRHSMTDTTINLGNAQPTISEIIAGRKEYYAKGTTIPNPDVWARDTVTYYHMVLRYPNW